MSLWSDDGSDFAGYVLLLEKVTIQMQCVGFETLARLGSHDIKDRCAYRIVPASSVRAISSTRRSNADI